MEQLSLCGLQSQYLLCDKASLLSVASDGMLCAVQNVSGHSAALVNYATNFFRSRPIVSTDGKCEIVQVPLCGAPESLSFAWFSV